MSTIGRLLHSLWQALGSTRLALVLLTALLLALSLASLIPQMPADPAAREPWLAAVGLRYRQATPMLSTLGLFNVYRAPWFLALLATLLISTLTCTVQRWPRVWRSLARVPIIARPEAFYRGFTQRAEWPVASHEQGLTAAHSVLAQHGYHPLSEHDESAGCTSIYGERGRWAQAGTLVSHVAALLLGLAVLAHPAVSWRESNVMLFPGQIQPVGHGRDFAVQAGQFSVLRHPTGQLWTYQVPLKVLRLGPHSDGVDVHLEMTGTVQLNQPLTYQGVAFHLQSYGPAAELITPEDTIHLAFADSQTQEVRLAGERLTMRVAYQPEGADLFVEALSSDGTLLGSGRVADSEAIDVQGMPISFHLTHYSVWQVSSDPTFGPAVVAAGLFLAAMAVSLWVPYRRLWLRVDNERLQIVSTGGYVGDFNALADALAQACRQQESLAAGQAPTPSASHQPARDASAPAGEADG